MVFAKVRKCVVEGGEHLYFGHQEPPPGISPREYAYSMAAHLARIDQYVPILAGLFWDDRLYCRGVHWNHGFMMVRRDGQWSAARPSSDDPIAKIFAETNAPPAEIIAEIPLELKTFTLETLGKL